MSNKLRTLGLVCFALALILVTARAQASSGYAGRWVGMKQGDLFTIKATGPRKYLGTTSQGFPIYLTERNGKLAGTVLHVATARVTIRFDRDFNHIVVALPGGMPPEYKRASQH